MKRVREIVYGADELAETLREWLKDLNAGKVDEVKKAIRDSIIKIETPKKSSP